MLRGMATTDLPTPAHAGFHAAAALLPRAGAVVAVHRSARHTVTKTSEWSVRLVAGHGVEGDVHAGSAVKHRYQVRKDPTRPNLRQVHLFAEEDLDDLVARGFPVHPGRVGENVTTRGLDLAALPLGTRLRLGGEAEVELTGLRTPCKLLDELAPGLMAAMLDRDERGGLVRRAGVMSVVVSGGLLRPGDPVLVELPTGDPVPLAPV